MQKDELQLSLESLKTELREYKKRPYACLFEYIWNSFDAKATDVRIDYILPNAGFGCIDEISILDNGSGWDFEKQENTRTFLTSTKSDNNKKCKKSLPRGQYGRGRYVFIWIADHLEIFSSKQRLILNKDIKVKPERDETADFRGTKVVICKPDDDFANIFFDEKKLLESIAVEFCWFLKQNKEYKISINGKLIDIEFNISDKISLGKEILSNEEDMTGINSHNFNVDIVIWKNKPTEWSNFFFLDENKDEISVERTGMNKQKDNFWHSVYIVSDFFRNSVLEDDDIDDIQLNLGDNSKKIIKNKVIKLLKQKLIDIRKPYLTRNSNEMVAKLEEEKLLPDLNEMGIYDEQSFKDLLKVAYTISPSLFVGREKREKKFICATFAGLLYSQDNDIIKIVLEQLQDLSEDEKEQLLDILNRTTLSNIVKTIKEIDYRLKVIDDLKKLVFCFEDDTLEVKHLQKVLDENFWIFGEQFKLFSSTEGALKDTLFRYAKDVLKIDNPEISTNSRKEVDLFLVKTCSESETSHKNIIVEIKRPKKVLGKNEYDQIEKYSIDIIKESICNGSNIYWEFYLIGNDFDDYIKKNKIENAKNFGEIQRGLTSNIEEGRVKIYVRKWSDILEVEWEHKMKFLEDKLKIKSKSLSYNNPQDIVEQYQKE